MNIFKLYFLESIVKRKQLAAYCFLLLSLYAAPLFADRSSNYLLVRSYYPTEETLSYQSLYLYYRFHYEPTEQFELNLSLVKGCREPGYYPAGYIQDAGWGLYEKGSYYLYIKERFGFDRIIVGNYVPLFGQGILFGGIYPAFFSNPYYDLARYRDTINPTGTVSKMVLLEGVALEFPIGDISVRPFFSWNQYDCTAGESSYYLYNDNDADDIPNDEDEDDFTGIGPDFPKAYSCKNNLFSCIGEEPDYEVESEREKRNKLSEYLVGVNLSVKRETYSVGGTMAYACFSRLVDPYYNDNPNEGDKTGHYFRGKDYISSNVYFKLYDPVEIFGELAGSVNKKLSYYSYFNGGYSTAVGFSGGIRGKIDEVGLIGWGAYLPANLVNPHALELPDGRNNIFCGLLGLNTSAILRRLTLWIYAYRELYSKDYPGNPETGLSYAYKTQFSLADSAHLYLTQNFEVIDGYYLAPESRSYKIATKLSLKNRFEEVDLAISLESRLGGPEQEHLRAGVGLGLELLRRKEGLNGLISVTYYNTEDDRYAYIYPYERSFAGWGFMSSSVKGHGLTGAVMLVKYFDDDLTLGARLKYRYDFYDNSYNGATIYLLSKVYF